MCLRSAVYLASLSLCSLNLQKRIIYSISARELISKLSKKKKKKTDRVRLGQIFYCIMCVGIVIESARASQRNDDKGLFVIFWIYTHRGDGEYAVYTRENERKKRSKLREAGKRESFFSKIAWLYIVGVDFVIES